MKTRVYKLLSVSVSFIACCFIISALLRPDWRQTDPGGPGKAISKSWSYYDGFWKVCSRWTVNGNVYCSGRGDFFVRFSYQLIWGRVLLIAATAASALGCLMNLLRVLVNKNPQLARKLYHSSMVFLSISALCICGISIWSALSVYHNFSNCAVQQVNGHKLNIGQCLRFGRGMYVAFWASGIAVLSVISLVFTPSRIENEDYEVNHQSRSYKYHTGCKADDLKVYV